jgi:hypothetical protein
MDALGIQAEQECAALMDEGLKMVLNLRLNQLLALTMIA